MSGSATLVIATIGTQTANTPFSVSITYSLNSGQWNEQLEYEDSDQTSFTPIAASAISTTTTSATFTHGGLPVGQHTISVKDPFTNTIVTSNQFNVVAGAVITVTPPTGVHSGSTFTLSGTLSGYTTIPTLSYRIDGGTPVTVTGVSTTAFSVTVPAPANGSHTVTVSDGTVVSTPVTFTVTATPTTITPNAINGAVAGQAYTFSGSLTGYTTAPALTYTLDNGTAHPVTGVTVNGWSMQLVAPSAGAHTISVSDGTTLASDSFTVADVAKAITAFSPNGVTVGSTFTFTGSLTNFTTIPALTYSIDGAAAQPLTGVTVNGWAMTLNAPGAGTHTITVTDATDSLSSSAQFNVAASGGGQPNTWSTGEQFGTIALSNGNYTATSGGSTTPYAAPAGILAETALSTTATQIIVWEVTASDFTPNWCTGIANTAWLGASNGGLGADTNSIGAYPSTGASSQPPQTVFFNNNQLGAGGTASANGEVITIAVNVAKSLFWFSDPTMRQTAGVNWNSTTTADPVAGTGGYSFTIAAPYFPAFGESEGGGVAVLNDGTSAFSTFLAAYITAHPGATVSLSGQTPVASKTITVNAPTNPVAGAAFNFNGVLSGYTSAPTLTYSLDNGTSIPVTGVTASGWSMAITIATSGSHTLSVTDGTTTGSVTFQVAATSGGGLNRVPAPLTGSVTKGTWQQNQRLTVAAMPNGFMQYDILMPAQYSSNFVYPIMIYGHENDEGMNGNSYPSSGLSTESGAIGVSDTNGASLSADTCFNTVAFRTAFPCIVVVPYCDQSLDTSGANPNANFGGYADTPNSGGNEQGIIALVNHLIQTLSVDTTRIYATGDSLGAIGTLAWLVDNNVYGTGTSNKLFAAGMGFSDQLYRPGVGGGSNNGAFNAMKSVPYLAIGTPNDNNVQIYDQAAWQFYTGNTNYPTPAQYTASGVAALKAGTSSFYFLNTTQDVPWNLGYRQLNADGGIGTPLYTWLFSQVGPGGSATSINITGVVLSSTQGTANAPAGTSVGTLTATSSGGALTGIAFAIASQSGPTSNAFKLSGTSIQFNSASVTAGTYTVNVKVTAGNAANSPQTYPVTITVAASGTGVFKVSQTGTYGSMVDPSGNPWKGRGINVYDSDMATVVTNAACQPLTTLFPGINLIRLACYSYQAHGAYDTFISRCTALGIVVVMEDHTNGAGNAGGSQGVIYTGTQLQNELNWYSALATAYAGNPYVWFGTDNEPSVNPSVAALSTWHQETYNAIRQTGNQSPILLDIAPPYTWPSMTASVYAAMTNVLWDYHSYDWLYSDPGSSSGYSSNPTVIAAGIVSNVQTLQQFHSQDGKIPVICAEYGISTDDQNLDPGGTQNVAGVQNAVDSGVLVGGAAWNWNSQGTYDVLTTGSNGLTTYGQQVAAWVTENSPASGGGGGGGTGQTNAAALKTWFGSIKGNGVVAGQFIEMGTMLGGVQACSTATGKQPGFLLGDMWAFDTTGAAGYGANQYLTQQWNQGGLVGYIFSMPSPAGGGGSQSGNAPNPTQLVTAGTAQNTAFNTIIDQIATGLQNLMNSGVGAIIIRPFHESNGNWFWWGTQNFSASQFIAMWQYFYNRLVNTHGLTQLVWVYSLNAGITTGLPDNRYPGSAYVDGVGYDLYDSNPAADTADYNYLLSTYPTKFLWMSEYGPNSPNGGDPSFNLQTLISALQSPLTNVVSWTEWGQNSGAPGWGFDEVSNVAALKSTRVLLAGEITFFP